jgi:hypothetical protein
VRDGCSVLDWAASGAMALTGLPDGPPVASPAAALTLLTQVTDDFAWMTGQSGKAVRADPAELIAGRAALAGLTRGGQVSAGGSSFLMRAADGWCAVTLSRPDDLATVPAVVGALGLDEVSGNEVETRAQARGVLAAAALGVASERFAAASQLLGVPAAALPADSRAPVNDCSPPAETASWPPWRASRIAATQPGGRLAGAVVADLSSMWAGPLCARLLGLAGAEVIKVESPTRPDGARYGSRGFFDWLHGGHRSLAVEFDTREGRAALAALLEVADIVIEASRPRALAAIGLAPEMNAHRPGQVWISITGYGRSSPELVAFGDDAAVAGGLVGWTHDERQPMPVFCADAIADPLTGACAALAVARSLAKGGGELIDLSMRDTAAAFASAAPDHGPHRVRPDGSVFCVSLGQEQAVLAPRRPALPTSPAERAPDLGADTAAVLAWLADRAERC